MGASLPVTFCILHSAFCIAAVAPLRIEVSPGASLADVRDCVRTLSPDDRTRSVEVVLAPGKYVLPEGLDLASEDGGVLAEAPVVWRAAKPGSVRIVGAPRIPPQSFRKVTDEALLARLPEEGRGRVWAAMLDISTAARTMPGPPKGAIVANQTRPRPSSGRRPSSASSVTLRNDCGGMRGKVFGSYVHPYFADNPELLRSILKQMQPE